LRSRLRGKRISEIAFYWRFNDSAHFSHAFKKEYRVGSRTFRSRVMLRLPVPGDSREQHQFLELAPVRRLRAN
jgi:AraC-like DNA-binding protein